MLSSSCITLHCTVYLIQGETTPVYVAASYGNVDILKMLIDAGGDVNIATVVSLYTIHVTGCLGMPWWVEPKRHTVVVVVCVCCFSAQLLKTRH